MLPVAVIAPVVRILPPAMLAVAVMFPVAVIAPAVTMLPPVMFPVAVTTPVERRLPPAMFPVADTTLAAMLVATIELIVRLPDTKLAACTVPVTDTAPPVKFVALTMALENIAVATSDGAKPDIHRDTGPTNLTAAVVRHALAGGHGLMPRSLRHWSYARILLPLLYKQQGHHWSDLNKPAQT